MPLWMHRRAVHYNYLFYLNVIGVGVRVGVALGVTLGVGVALGVGVGVANATVRSEQPMTLITL